MRLSGWMLIVLIAIMILAAAGAAVLTVSWFGPLGSGRPGMGELVQEDNGPAGGPLGPIYNAGVFTVNLSNAGRGNRFVRATIALEVDSRKTVQALEEREPAVRDAIIVTLRGYTPEDLATPEGFASLREEIRAATSALLPEGKVRYVYFQEFITQ